MAGKSYRDLEVWQRAMDVVVACYGLTKAFPPSELYGLASQLQRAAVSVPANIAEGQARQHAKEFRQHLAIANGSLAELETHILIAERLGYSAHAVVQDVLARTDQVGRMITGLRKFLRSKRQLTNNQKPTTRNRQL
jgi:four helix bundle protein